MLLKEEHVVAKQFKMDPILSRQKREHRTWLGVLLLFLFVVIVGNAWIAEDAFIMFRTIDNFVNGYGLTWNVGERVQTFTDPLWTLLLAAINVVSGELYFTTLALSMVCTIAAVVILARITASTAVMIAAIVPLIFSKAFIDYSTSGLENPFTFLALAVFYRIFFKPLDHRPGWHLFQLSLIAALAMLNRMDTVLLFAPALAFEFYRVRGWRPLLSIVAGFLPFLIWELFAIIYYGFPFPNTAYAKLNTGIPISDRIVQGLNYLLNSIVVDPITIYTLVVAISVMIISRKRQAIPVVAGAILYICYVVWVGGDFMSGRFLTAPLFLALIGMAASAPDQIKRVHALSFGVLVMIFGTANRNSPVRSDASYSRTYTEGVDENGIADERGYYYQATGLLNVKGGSVQHVWRSFGEQAARKADKQPVVVFWNIGIFGYYAGPAIHLIDPFALADPLLARLPADEGSRIGHFSRELPGGYVNTIRSGENRIVHPDLAQYYDVLRDVISGPIFSLDRFKKLFLLNMGGFDHLIDSYLLSRYLVVRPLNDLLEEDLFAHHRSGQWGEWNKDHIWAVGKQREMIFDLQETRSGMLNFTVDHPFPKQELIVLLNGDRIGNYSIPEGDTLNGALPIELPAGRNRLTFLTTEWNSRDAPVVEGEDREVSVRFHELGIRFTDLREDQ